MKHIGLCIFILFILAGCSTTGQISGIGGQDGPGESLNVENRPVVVEKRTPQPESARKGTPPPEQPTVTDDEDNIASLIHEEKFQNFDIPIVFNDAVRYYIDWFSTEKRKVFGNWLRRAGRYVPAIKQILRERGMPEDLVYLAMIESGFNPKAYSPAKACGPWQFIYATGERYGLKVNFWIDERRDPEKSTVAAAKYLRDLFNQFGCWYLAAAGYNAGEKRVERAIERHNTNDFWELARYNALPRETREYIPKLIAAAIIAKEPEKYGFDSINYDNPLTFVEVRVPRGTPLSAVARAASLDLAAVRSYNPEIIRGITPPDVDGYEIKLPAGIGISRFSGNLEAALKDEKRIKSVTAYKVKKKDTFAGILKRYKVGAEDFCLINGYEGEQKLKPGTVVYIPRFGGSSSGKVVVAQAVSEPGRTKTGKGEKGIKTVKPVGTTERKSIHVVKRGETLASISEKYGMDVDSIKAENNLKSDKVYPNMKLRLASFADKGERQTKKTPKKRIHVVKKGETLSSISGKYGVDIFSLKEDNNLKSDKVYPRMKLRVPVDAG